MRKMAHTHPHPHYKISQFTAILSCPNLFIPEKCWFLWLPQKTVCRNYIEYLQLCAVALYKLQFQKAVAIMLANIPSEILELIIWLCGCRLSQRAILRSTGLLQGGISKVLRHVRETGRAVQRPYGHRLMMITPMEECTLIWIMMRNGFLSSLRIRVKLIMWAGHHVCACVAQRRLVAASITQDVQPDAQDWLMIIATNIVYEHAGTGTGTISTGLMWYLLMSPCYFLPLWWSCRSSSACWWETSGLLHKKTDGNVGPSLMVWGVFHASCKSELMVVDGTVNQKCYIGILRQNFPWARVTFQRNFVLVHDNVTPPNARNRRNFLVGGGGDWGHAVACFGALTYIP